MSRSTDRLNRLADAASRRLDRAPIDRPEGPPARSVKGVGFCCETGSSVQQREKLGQKERADLINFQTGCELEYPTMTDAETWWSNWLSGWQRRLLSDGVFTVGGPGDNRRELGELRAEVAYLRDALQAAHEEIASLEEALMGMPAGGTEAWRLGWMAHYDNAGARLLMEDVPYGVGDLRRAEFIAGFEARQELEMQGAAEPETCVGCGAAIGPWMVAGYDATGLGELCAGCFRQLPAAGPDLDWGGSPLVGYDAPLAMEELGRRTRQILAQELRMSGSPQLGCAHVYDTSTGACGLCGVDMAASGLVAMADPPAPAGPRVIAGHVFEGIGGARRCVLAAYSGKPGELCNRYWDEISGDNRLKEGEPGKAHIGCATIYEVDQVIAEEARLAAEAKRLEEAIMGYAGKSGE